MPDLFVWGEFQSHSGLALNWKIDCDALTNDDIATCARVIAGQIRHFTTVEGVPRGGLRLAAALQSYCNTDFSGGDRLLIVDDVCTTGRSLQEHRRGRIAAGYVIFSRGGLPSWCRALFVRGV